jgi:UDP-N-acetylglucosamine:LPS N-acetylglucosamine transferase
LIPHFNRPLIESVNAALPDVPFLTVMTDLADYPPDFWIVPGSAQHIVCGTDKAVAQARAMGVAEARIHRASGMVLHPDFYGPELVDAAHERDVLGLDPERRTGIVMFGGHGAPAMQTIARQLDDVQLVLMCGHNDALAGQLRKMRVRAPHAVVGFTPHVRKYMQLGDFFVGKPGPGSLSEAVHLGLPIITFRNPWTMPQERYNADWVRENRLGIVVKSARAVRPAVLELIGNIEFYRANVRRIMNTAVFEVVSIMASQLAASPLQQPAQADRRRRQNGT